MVINTNKINIVVILNNIRSNENVGSIFRTADATGVSKIFLCGYTPAPTDRFGRENRGLTKASLGAEKSVEWEKVESLNKVIIQLKTRKNFGSSSLKGSHGDQNFSQFLIVGIEQNKTAIDYRKLKNYYLKFLPRRQAGKNYNLALVFGNEVEGLSKEDLKLCDLVAALPMHGNKESLNVAVCAGVVLYSLI